MNWFDFQTIDLQQVKQKDKQQQRINYLTKLFGMCLCWKALPSAKQSNRCIVWYLIPLHIDLLVKINVRWNIKTKKHIKQKRKKEIRVRKEKRKRQDNNSNCCSDMNSCVNHVLGGMINITSISLSVFTSLSNTQAVLIFERQIKSYN